MTIDYTLKNGSHDNREAGMCAMEWVAYLAGEEHTDSPICVDPPLRSYGISLNDSWDDEQRQKLRPYLARCIGTAGDGRTEERGWLAIDWLIREFTPAFLELHPDLKHHAEKLRNAPAVLAPYVLDDAMVLLREAQKDAAAAGAAAWDAAGAAARDAAGAAAWEHLAPTVTHLQASALDLFDRMLPTEIVELPDSPAKQDFEVLMGVKA
jgi:hypothetical protein